MIKCNIPERTGRENATIKTAVAEDYLVEFPVGEIRFVKDTVFELDMREFTVFFIFEPAAGENAAAYRPIHILKSTVNKSNSAEICMTELTLLYRQVGCGRIGKISADETTAFENRARKT